MKTYQQIQGSYYEDLLTTGHKSQSWFYRTREQLLLEFARLRPGQRVLDIGCGSGTVTRAIARRGCPAVGVDVSEACIAYATGKAQEEGLDATFLVGSIEALPFADRSFDCIIASHIIEHVEQPGRIIRDMYRLLTPGGTLILTTPNYLSLWPLAEAFFDHTLAGEGYSLHEQHVVKFNAGKLRSVLVAAGFAGVKVEAQYILTLPISLFSSRAATAAFALEKRLASLPLGTILYARGRKT
ncbi:MAG: methyltransferase domain-containing protein [Candidatus Aenigmarchaeota archaeon]|nr:methyltransferase domain-containing protein [Candidatus Aenigmarchaeota archaeon]